MLHRPDPSQAEQRRRRYRERRRRGLAVYSVELGPEELEFLRRNLWVTEEEIAADDRQAIGEGIARMIAASARR